jgi:hypothetical protein
MLQLGATGRGEVEDYVNEAAIIIGNEDNLQKQFLNSY